MCQLNVGCSHKGANLSIDEALGIELENDNQSHA